MDRDDDHDDDGTEKEVGQNVRNGDDGGDAAAAASSSSSHAMAAVAAASAVPSERAPVKLKIGGPGPGLGPGRRGGGGGGGAGGSTAGAATTASMKKRKRRTTTTTTSPSAATAPKKSVFDDDDDVEDDDDDDDQKKQIKMLSLEETLSSSSSSSASSSSTPPSSSSSSSDDEDADRTDHSAKNKINTMNNSDKTDNNEKSKRTKYEEDDGGGDAGDSGEMATVSDKRQRTREGIMKRKNEVDNDDGDATPAADLEDDGDNMPSGSSNASTKPATETHCDGQDQKQKQEGKEAQQRQQQKTQIKDTPEQPEGWRVKLYRLNGDGSWDDCGTGRISCLQKPTPSNNNNTNSIKGGINSNSNSNNNNGSSKSSNSTGNRSSPNYQHHHHQNSDVWAYHELGEPTLCMHSEVPNSNKNKSSNNTDNLQQQQPASSSAAVPPESRILLRTRILLRDQYQRQGDNIITWCEPYSEEGTDHSQGVDLALSFQDNAGCLDIWRKIHQVQSRAADLFRRRSAVSSSNSGSVVTNDSSGSTEEKAKEKHNTGLATNGRGGSVADVAQAVAAAHHASIPRQEQCEMWVNVVSEAQQQQQQDGHGDIGNDNDNENDHVHDQFDDVTSPFQDMSGSASASGSSIAGSQQPQLPNPPTLANLEDIADTIAAVQHIQHKENLAMYIAQNDCSYLKSLLSLFPKAEDLGDYGSLATLAACVKTILLLNEPGIIELVVMDEVIFEEVCATLEYDPDLRDKADHRWFLRERVKFRTVTLMEDEELMSAIHRSFRVCYMRDTLLRPTMDENCLSTLSSLQTFTHADVVKGVTMSPVGSDDEGELLRDSYLAKVIRVLGRELEAMCDMEWNEVEERPEEETIQSVIANRSDEPLDDPSTIVAPGKYQKFSTIWKQHLAPQDGSLKSRRIRRRGSIAFLRELFNMVRVSLQPTDKDDFFAVLVSMDVDLSYDKDTTSCDDITGEKKAYITENDAKTENRSYQRNKPVNLISLLATVLSYPGTDPTEKGAALEIIAGIAMHDPSLIRKRCLDFFACWKNDQKVLGVTRTEKLGPSRLSPNEKNQVIFQAPPNDLLSALLFLLAVETDAGILLQVSEIMRIVLDTDVMGDHGLMTTGFADEAEGIPPSGGHNPPHDQHPNPTGTGNPPSTEQNQFLTMFYDHYIEWLAAPFQYQILYPVLRQPITVLSNEVKSEVARKMESRFLRGQIDSEPLLYAVPFCGMRSSFAVELLSFCVRAHLYRMKFYLLRTQVLWNVLKLLKPSSLPRNASGERCLKLATLRFLRAVLSVNDDSYHRHIIYHDLFGPVFEAFRANPVGDNLVSSSIVEMCDFINTENINTLIEHIATKHLSSISNDTVHVPSLEDVSSPYVSTLTVLRRAYEKLLEDRKTGANNTKALTQDRPGQEKPEQSRYLSLREEEEYFS